MKKGFTLIELLAVIVILTVILLIATPIVLNLINDTDDNATIVSVEFYIDAVEQSIATSNLKNGKTEDGTYSIMQDGNLCIGTLKDNTCTGEILKIEMNGELPNEGFLTIKNGKTTYLKLTLNDKVVKKNTKGKLVVVKTVADYIKNLYSETKTTTVNGIEYSLDETHSLMNDRLGNINVGKIEGNIRYYGSDPNNYVDIGDRDKDGNIIFWRIIGLFRDIEVTDEEGKVIRTEDLVKIIRTDKLTYAKGSGFSWDYTSTGANDNNWHDSTLQLMLNDEVNGFYGSGTTSYYNYRENQAPTPMKLDFTSIGLSSKSHDKIERVNWNLGVLSNNSVYINSIYEYERLGTNKWSGKIALMNPSDYGYASDLNSCQSLLNLYNKSTCTSTNWIYDSTIGQWTIIPYSSNSSHTFCIDRYGIPTVNGANAYYHSVRPVLYLKSDVGILEENKTKDGIKYFVLE